MKRLREEGVGAGKGVFKKIVEKGGGGKRV